MKEAKSHAVKSKRGLKRFSPKSNLNNSASLCFFAYCEQKRPQQFFGAAAKNIARPKSRVALDATRPSAAVAEDVYFGKNIAPAQQRNS